jgi:hypothetical protein
VPDVAVTITSVLHFNGLVGQWMKSCQDLYGSRDRLDSLKQFVVTDTD